MALSRSLVQKSMNQMLEHNLEDADALYTRPTLDLYLCNKHWKFISKGLEKEELEDLEKAKE